MEGGGVADIKLVKQILTLNYIYSNCIFSVIFHTSGIYCINNDVFLSPRLKKVVNSIIYTVL